jgi:hypothetical protein
VTGSSGPLRTPDGRYLIFIGSRGPRLWRASNPGLRAEERDKLTKELMAARRAVRFAENGDDLVQARKRVHAAKVALGERGPVWWNDGEPDLNRKLVAETPYARWYAKCAQSASQDTPEKT